MKRYQRKFEFASYILQMLIGLISVVYLGISFWLYKLQNIEAVTVYILAIISIYSIPVGLLKLLYMKKEKLK